MSSNEQHSTLDARFGAMGLGDTTGHMSPAAQDAFAMPPPPPPNSAMNNHMSAANPQSASARFERFFNTGHQGSDPYNQMAGFPNAGYPGQASGSYGQFGGSMGSFGSASSAQGPGFRQNKMPSGTRNNIPTSWSADPGFSPNFGPSGSIPSPISPPPHISPSGGPFAPGALGSNPGSGFLVQSSQVAGPSDALLDDDVIPTAIVVKNIPFSVKKEQLLQIIEDLAIPMPYAFNYHFDQGVFRGLAFANFRTPEEADAVVAALNGFDVAGRKLRVEYKKVLQAGEKERIEKEKALKRMKSMQMEKERLRREQEYGAQHHPVPPLPIQRSPFGQTKPLPSEGGLQNGSYSYSPEKASSSAFHHRPPSRNNTFPVDALSPPGLSSQPLQPTASTSSENDPEKVKKEELNLNDAQTLEIYSRVLLFKDDRMRDELAFSRSLSPQERRTVHLVAQKLNLYHYSVGEGDERHVIVTKHEVTQNGHRPLRSQASTIGRSQRAIGSGVVGDYSSLSNGHGTGDNGLLSPANSGRMSAAAIKAKKSAPDMKRFSRDIHEGVLGSSPSNNGSFGGSAMGAGPMGQGAFAYGTGSLGGGGGQVFPSDSWRGSNQGLSGSNSYSTLGQKSSSSLRDSYSSTGSGSNAAAAVARRGQPGGGIGGAAGLQSLFSSPFDVPPVPSLGASSYGSNAGVGSIGSGFVQRSDSPLGNGSTSGHSVSSTTLSNGAGGGSGSTHFLTTPSISSMSNTSASSNAANGSVNGSSAIRQPRGPPTPGAQASEGKNFSQRHAQQQGQQPTTIPQQQQQQQQMQHSQMHRSSQNFFPGIANANVNGITIPQSIQRPHSSMSSSPSQISGTSSASTATPAPSTGSTAATNLTSTNLQSTASNPSAAAALAQTQGQQQTHAKGDSKDHTLGEDFFSPMGGL